MSQRACIDVWPDDAVPGLGLCHARQLSDCRGSLLPTAIWANTIRFDGATSDAGASVEGFSSASSILNVPERKLFAGSIGLAITLPLGHIDVEAMIGPLGIETRWLGFGDITSRAQAWRLRTPRLMSRR